MDGFIFACGYLIMGAVSLVFVVLILRNPHRNKISQPLMSVSSTGFLFCARLAQEAVSVFDQISIFFIAAIFFICAAMAWYYRAYKLVPFEQ